MKPLCEAKKRCLSESLYSPLSCRVPEELKKHSLSDGQGGQYSTNLDRNRYGSDDQYLSTVIRYDLEYLNLCPCLVDVEIIDAKLGSGTVMVSAGDQACVCDVRPQGSDVSWGCVPGRWLHPAPCVAAMPCPEPTSCP